MIVTCPACGRKTATVENAREVVCDCGRRFDPAARPTVADPWLGREIGGAYRVDEIIGTGGMGTVYRATQLSLGRSVALKVLPPNVADDPQFVQRFHREAEVLASLSHPHIVQVFDRGEDDGRFFLVMEYIDGTSLRDYIRRGRVPQKEACRILAQLLDALDYAHDRGVIHRDIKPENVLVSKDGVVKVADFGLSRVLGGDEADTRLTRTHLVLGTYEYMAPEQREAVREADGRADIYATAVVFYEMLTGELPIGRFDLPSQRVPGLDKRIDAVVERALAKDPDRRFARASSMGDAIETLVTTPDAPVDLGAIKQAAGRFAHRVQETVTRGVREVVGRVKDRAPRAPTAFEMRLDLMLTMLAVSGILLAITGLVLLIDHEEFDIGLLDIDRDIAGVVVLIYGLLLWNASERARKYWPGARTTVLWLTALGGLTVVGLPLTIWAWTVLLNPKMRLYFDARHRGMSGADAAAVAQGLPLPEGDHEKARERLREAAGANRRVAFILLSLALAGWLAWFIGFFDGPKAFKDEGAAFFFSAAGVTILGWLFFRLGSAVSRRQLLRLNAWVWGVIGILWPGARRRARLLLRDRRDGLI